MYQVAFTMSPVINLSSLRPSKAEIVEIKAQMHRAVEATVDDVVKRAIKKLRADQEPKKKRRAKR